MSYMSTMSYISDVAISWRPESRIRTEHYDLIEVKDSPLLDYVMYVRYVNHALFILQGASESCAKSWKLLYSSGLEYHFMF